MPDSTQRFSNRVDSYVKYRPSYPSQAIDKLVSSCRITPATTIAEIGSGTGILTKLLLERGLSVQAIEPNRPMREAAERLLASHFTFSSLNATAESTGLPDSSVDLVVAAQAFHWFDLDQTKTEFRRILKPGGYLALLWNERLTDTTPFLRDYENLLTAHATDYSAVNHANITDADIEAFFAPAPVRKATFENQQSFDYSGLEGRCLSSSYVPAPEHPSHATFFRKLQELFARHQRDGQVHFDYKTTLYTGLLG
ncbi:Methyltransferase domain family [Verrucomicrobiia bacterium DG1235]|nr:Methyltransferase domain family [Verrucomicrobiae bacterium DG1235]